MHAGDLYLGIILQKSKWVSEKVKGEKHPLPPEKWYIADQVTSVGNWRPIPLGNLLVNHVEHSAEFSQWQKGELGYLSLSLIPYWLRVEK